MKNIKKEVIPRAYTKTAIDNLQIVHEYYKEKAFQLKNKIRELEKTNMRLKNDDMCPVIKRSIQNNVQQIKALQKELLYYKNYSTKLTEYIFDLAKIYEEQSIAHEDCYQYNNVFKKYSIEKFYKDMTNKERKKRRNKIFLKIGAALVVISYGILLFVCLNK